MKKLILSLVMIGFAVAVQAGDSKNCTGKDKAACNATKVSGAACCSMTKATTCKGTATKQVALMSPKGAEQAPRMILASK